MKKSNLGRDEDTFRHHLRANLQRPRLPERVDGLEIAQGAGWALFNTMGSGLFSALAQHPASPWVENATTAGNPTAIGSILDPAGES